jgi:hypothetical protein
MIHLVGVTILQVPAPILGALLECLAACRTPTRRGERFDHHFIILPRCSHVTGKAEYKTSFSCTAVMIMSVSLAGVTCNFPDVLITTDRVIQYLPPIGVTSLAASPITTQTLNRAGGPDQRKDVKISFKLRHLYQQGSLCMPRLVKHTISLVLACSKYTRAADTTACWILSQ